MVSLGSIQSDHKTSTLTKCHYFSIKTSLFSRFKATTANTNYYINNSEYYDHCLEVLLTLFEH